MRRCSFLALALCLATTATVHAGPVERFNHVTIDAKMPAELALVYMYGGGGLFLSGDGGKSFGLLCNSAIDKSIQRDVSAVHFSGTGAIYLGAFDGMWRGDKGGCGWQQVADLKGKWVSAIAADPIDPTITYAVTSNGGVANGMYVNDGKSDAWTAVGMPVQRFRDTLHVVKTEAGKRFYETSVSSQQKTDANGKPIDEIHYYIRYSDDGGVNWTESEFDGATSLGTNDSVHIRAIDPTDTHRIVVQVATSADKALDTLFYSPMAGKAGSWVKVGEGITLEAVAFTPTGTLAFADNDQDKRQLWVVEKLGMPAKMISDTWRVGCLQWDGAGNRMFACNEWQFGTVDLTTGMLTKLLDMRTAPSFTSCPGEEDLAMRCKAQLLSAYCGPGHFEDAPLCSPYKVASGGAGSGGNADVAAAGSGGDTGSSTSAGASAAAGSSEPSAGKSGSATTAGKAAAAAGSGAAPKSGSSGCSCALAGTAHAHAPAPGVLLGGLAVMWLSARRRRRPRA